MPKCILTNEDKEDILSKSDKFTAKQLAEQYGCSRSTILKLWIDNDYHKPLGFSYYVNDNYFSKIDTANKAYIMGLIASDGNLYKRDNHQGQIRLSFQYGDSEYNLLENILMDMNSTHPIQRNVKTLNEKTFEYIAITIVSQQIFEDLCNMGITQQKTWLMNIKQVINQIPKQFIRDFLRGYFDGDGSITGISKNKPSSVSVNIAMPLQNAKLLQQILHSLGLEAVAQEDNRPNKYSHPFGRFEFFGVNKYIFLKWIYYEGCLCLQRKYDLALQYCNLVENNITNRAENINAVNQYCTFLKQNKMIKEEELDDE